MHINTQMPENFFNLLVLRSCCLENKLPHFRKFQILGLFVNMRGGVKLRGPLNCLSIWPTRFKCWSNTRTEKVNNCFFNNFVCRSVLEMPPNTFLGERLFLFQGREEWVGGWGEREGGRYVKRKLQKQIEAITSNFQLQLQQYCWWQMIVSKNQKC